MEQILRNADVSCCCCCCCCCCCLLACCCCCCTNPHFFTKRHQLLRLNPPLVSHAPTIHASCPRPLHRARRARAVSHRPSAAGLMRRVRRQQQNLVHQPLLPPLYRLCRPVSASRPKLLLLRWIFILCSPDLVPSVTKCNTSRRFLRPSRRASTSSACLSRRWRSRLKSGACSPSFTVLL